MAFTKKHYRETAEMLFRARSADLRTPEEAICWVEGYMSSLFDMDNPRFDPERFRRWCETGTDK